MEEQYMLRNQTDLIGFTIVATDGEIGAVKDFYFDDGKWTIRYMVVDTGSWLTGRRVLISPISLGAVDWQAEKLHVNLSKAQVQNSPDINTLDPISRRHEITLTGYYGYPYYWDGSDVWGGAALPIDLPIEGVPERETEPPNMDSEEEFHLHSTQDVIGYAIEATDGDIGHVDDFVLDDASWQIRYIAVDTRNWLPGKKVLVAPGWIHQVSWRDAKVYVNLSRVAIENSPEYDSSKPIGREYETMLYQHYDQPRYWDRKDL
jgi:uncharacterized protein YrrD